MAEAISIALCGEFTIFTANENRSRLAEAITGVIGDIEVDLGDVTEIDSAGLQLMVMAKREATALGKKLRFTQHSAPVLDLLDLCDLGGFFGDPVVIRSTL